MKWFRRSLSPSEDGAEPGSTPGMSKMPQAPGAGYFKRGFMKCAIMQPTYLPWLGYFALMGYVDKFVYLNDVQFEKQSWQTRNRIKTKTGEQWLSVQKSAHSDRLIDDVILVNKEHWTGKHLKSIGQNYRKAKYFDEVFPVLETLITNRIDRLAGYNITIIEGIAKRLCIKTERVKANKLDTIGNRCQRLIDICKVVDCDTYVSPPGSKDYMEDVFTDIEYFEFEHPEYEQLHGEFISHLSIVDYLMHCGFQRGFNGWTGTKKEDLQKTTQAGQADQKEA